MSSVATPGAGTVSPVVARYDAPAGALSVERFFMPGLVPTSGFFTTGEVGLDGEWHPRRLRVGEMCAAYVACALAALMIYGSESFLLNVAKVEAILILHVRLVTGFTNVRTSIGAQKT